jgi:hypothetical protein
MKTVAAQTTTTVTVYTRDTADCPKRDDRYWKRCKCRKALYIHENGRDRKVSARTRSWEQAERLAQLERDRRDPAKRLLQEIKEQEVQKRSLQQEKNITVQDASDQWYATKKFKTSKTSSIYGRAARRIKTWAKDQGRRISDSQQFEQVEMVPGGFQSFSFDATLERFVLFKQIEGDAIEDGEVLRRMSGSFSIQVFAKAYIEHPV